MAPRLARRGTSPHDKTTAAAAGASKLTLKNTQRVELPNGLTLILFENRRLPIVVAEAHVRRVDLFEPEDKVGIVNLVGRLLDEGTAKHSGQKIAEMIEDVGGSLSMDAEGGSFKVLSPDRKLGFSLLFECLTTPTFPKDAFTRHQKQVLSEIADDEKKPDSRADELYRSLLYGKHPYGRPELGTAKVVEKLTAEDCKAFHRQVFVPNNTVMVVVGDFDSKEVVEEIKQLTADWKKSPLDKPKIPDVPPPARSTQKVITLPDAKQLYFYMGHPGIKRSDPDYYKLLVMDYVLGTGPGFTDRLSSRLRDREGLAYTVSARITSDAGEEPGLFTCYIGTEAGNFLKVKRMFMQELNRIRTKKPELTEVEDAKKYLLGSMAFRLTTNDRIAGQLMSIEIHQLGLTFFDDYKKAVSAVTPEDVHAVAKKHLVPKKMVLVVAGPVGPAGRPLMKTKGKGKQ